MLLRIENLTFITGDALLLKPLNMSIFPGNIVNFHGANGIGKTSLIKVISGLKRKNSGIVEFIADEDENAEMQIRFFGHKLAIKERISVLDHLIFYAKLHQTEILIAATAKYFKLEAILDLKCQFLSQGQKKMVSLARLMLAPTAIWVIDEPFANLDQDNHDLLANLITSKTNNGGIVIITSHQKLDFSLNIDLNDYV